MNIESKVVSLELARMLKDAGVVIETQYEWYQSGITTDAKYKLGDSADVLNNGNHWSIKYPAPDTSELLEILPHQIMDSKFIFYFLKLEKDKHGWTVSYRNATEDIYYEDYTEEIETINELLGRTLLYLAENGLLEVGKII